jgi:hypothetical protein
VSRVKINENNIFTILTLCSTALTILFAVTGLIVVSLRFAAGVATGGFVAIANCHWLYNILQRAMQLPARQAVRFAQLRYVIRLLIIAVIVTLLILYVKIDIFGLLLGLSVVVISIIVMAIHMATHNGG